MPEEKVKETEKEVLTEEQQEQVNGGVPNRYAGGSQTWEVKKE